MRATAGVVARRTLIRWADLRLQTKGLVVVALPLIALLVAALAFTGVQRDARQAESRVAYTLEVQAAIQTALTLLVDAETSVRGYALSGQDEFLDPYRIARDSLPGQLDRLERLVQDNPAQVARLRRVEALVTERFDALTALRAYGDDRSSDPPESLLLAGKRTMDTLRQELGAMQDEEERLLTERTARAEQANRRATAAIALIALIGAIGGLIASTLFTTGVVRRVGHLEANAHQLADGRPLQDPPGGKDEIGRLGRALQQSSDLLRAREAELHDSLHQLATQTKALEAKTREQDAFVYTVSHDLRAPLVSLQGLAGLLVEDYGSRLDGEGRRYLDRIAANAARMQAMVDDLLHLSRVGRDPRAAELVDLDTVVTQVTEQLQHTLRARGAAVEVEGDLPTVCGNPVQLAQVFANLIDNAATYTPPERTPLVRVSATERAEDWEITVRDNGVGIPRAFQEKVFGLFQRLPAGRALNPNGSGAGLAIVARVVEAHGGQQRIESEEGQGTTFHFTLPKAAGGLPAPQLAATTSNKRKDGSS